MIALPLPLHLALLAQAAVQAPGVGDTIRLERLVTAPPGWTVRAGAQTDWGEIAELLEPPQVAPSPSGSGWVIRYAAVSWHAGPVALLWPPASRVGPEGEVDSVPREWITVQVASVLPAGGDPDTLAPRPPLPPVLGRDRSPLSVLGALGLATVLLVAGVRWRRRAPRSAPDAGADRSADAWSDARWISAGEYRAVAARAMAELRGALMAAAPDLAESLSVDECAAALEASHAQWPVREVVETLRKLEQAAFAAAVGPDVASLAARARALARELTR